MGTEFLSACKLTRSKCLINISQAGSRTYLNLCLAFNRLFGYFNNRSIFERTWVKEKLLSNKYRNNSRTTLCFMAKNGGVKFSCTLQLFKCQYTFTHLSAHK